MRIALLPFFKIQRFIAWFLLLFRRPFPWLVSLLHGFRVGPLAGVVCGFFFAHDDYLQGQHRNSSDVPVAGSAAPWSSVLVCFNPSGLI
jgi:hypothetical protein